MAEAAGGPAAGVPAGTVAHVTGRLGTGVAVVAGGGRYQVVAGPFDRPEAQIVLDGLDRAALRAFAEAVIDAVATRSGEPRHVPFDQPFPVSAQLAARDGVLNVYDDGETFSVMAVAVGHKAGTGTGPGVDDVRGFAATLSAHLAAQS